MLQKFLSLIRLHGLRDPLLEDSHRLRGNL